MKKLALALVLLTSAVTASAHGWEERGGYRGGHGYHGGGNWVAPALIGGIIGYELARPYYYNPPVVYTQPQVIYSQPQVIYNNPAPIITNNCPAGSIPYIVNNQVTGCVQQ